MQIYILNRARETLATTASIYNDKHTLTLEAGSSSYEFTIDKSDEASHYMDSGNYIVLQDDKGKTWLFTILDYEETHNTKTVYAEDAGIELINKAVDIWKGDGPHPFSYYFDLVTKGTPWKLGVNQLAGLERTLTYEGRDTGLGRLLSILKGFDNAECTFDVTVKMNTPAEFKINVYKQVGNDRSDVQIVYNNELNDITKKESRAEFVTALAGVGGQIQTEDGSGGGNVDFSELEYDKNGFVTKKGDKFLRAVDANRTFNPGQESYIESFYEYDTQSPSELLNRTLSKLKTYSEPQYIYTADVKVIDASLVLGDTVTILDHDYNPALYLSARVAKLVKSYTDPAQNEIEFTNYRLLNSALADKLARLQVIVNTLPSASRVSAIETNLTKLTKQQEEVIVKVESANGKNTNYYGGSQPENAKQGDSWFYTDEEGNQGIKQYQNGVWVDVISSKFGPKLEADIKQAQDDMQGLSDEVEEARSKAQEAFAKAGFNADEISNVKTATSEVTETLTSTVRQASELSESLKNVVSETASRYNTVSSELSGARNSLTAKASELAKEVASNSANITKANSQLYSQSEGLAKVSQSATKMEQTMTDLSGRVHTVETTASETKEALADAKGNITTLTKRADGTDTKIADAQGRVQTLESRAGKWDLELSKKVDNTTYNAGIQNLGNQINLKANKSDLDGYATKAQLSVESDRITQQASAISSVTTIANGANIKIDNLSFGGRNLLDNTDPTAFQKQDWNVLGQWWYGSGGNGTCTIETLNDSKYTAKHYFRIVGNTGGNRDFQQNFVPEDTTYTFSVKIRLYKDANVYNPTILVRNFAQKDGIQRIRYMDKVKGLSKDYWTDFSVTFSAHDIATVGGTASLQFGLTETGSVEFLEPQLEKASRPSDYSLSQNDLQRLASEDTASQINQYNTGTVQPIKGIANDALGKANNANDKIDGLRIGGRNLLKGTSDQFKTISNSGWMWAHTWTNNDNNTSKISLASFHTGDYLTYSAWVINDSDVDVIPEVTFFDKNLGNSNGTRGNILRPGQSGLVTNTRQIGSNDWYVRPTIISTKGQAGVHQIRIKEEMLTLGNVNLPWQPSDLDLPDTIISTVTTTTNAKQIVDKSGIYSEVTKLVDTKVGNVTTQLDSYKHTVDDTGNKLRDVMGALKLDSNGNLTSNFNELIKTASGVEERYTQLNGKIDGLGGGVNLATKTSKSLQSVNVTSAWLFVGHKSSSHFNDLPSYQGKHITVRVWIERPTADAWVQIWTNKGAIRGNHIKAGQSGYSTASGVIPTGFTDWNIPIGGGAPTMSFGWKEFKIELGEVATPWTPALEDVSTEIAKTNETIKTVDGNVTTVKNNLDKTKSVVTQLANLFDVTVGDSSISVTNGGVLVKGKQIHIDGQTLIDNGVIQGAKIADASIGTAKIADAAITSAKIANLDVNKLSGNKSTFVQSVWNGISNSVNITPTGLESASGSNQTTITGGRIETNSLWAKDYITVGRHESDPRQRWGVDIDRKGMWFGVPVKKNGAVGNNAGDYSYEIQGAIKGCGWDYSRTTINGNGSSGIMIGLAEQGMWGGNYGGDFIGIGRFVKNEYQNLDSAQHDFALTYNATSAGFAVPGNAVHIWKDTYIHGTTHLGYDGITKNKVGIRTAWVSWSDWHNERYACLVNDGPNWGGIAFPYNGNTVIFSWSGKRDSWAGSGTQYTGYGDY
ncbi:MAG: hypothetical protein SOY59_06290 [Ligilactobacillus agilis]|nr:hypothetical protein [Ligilactobacillus agilis]